jgi:small subunit ribosomal protein S4e
VRVFGLVWIELADAFDRITNIFVIGEGNKGWVSLPKGKGTKLTIAEERDVRRKQRAADS